MEGSNLSVALAQEELFEKPPARRVIVPAGCSSWWGVDPSSVRVAIGTVNKDGLRRVRSRSFPRVDGASRLSAIYAETRDLAVDVATLERPGLILVEQPSGGGQVVNHELEYAVGVIQAAVYDGALSVLGSAPRLVVVTSSWWKKAACGRGDIRKTVKVDGKKRLLPLEEYGVLRWARLNGYEGRSWDESDALAMAEAGRRTYGLDER